MTFNVYEGYGNTYGKLLVQVANRDYETYLPWFLTTYELIQI